MSLKGREKKREGGRCESGDGLMRKAMERALSFFNGVSFIYMYASHNRIQCILSETDSNYSLVQFDFSYVYIYREISYEYVKIVLNFLL